MSSANSLTAKAEGMTHKIAGLFSGVGGLERGLHRAGHRTLILCENDPSAGAVLSARFPDIQLHGDVRTLKSLPRGATLVAAGFPCQDLSQAGIAGSRSGLVGEVFHRAGRLDPIRSRIKGCDGVIGLISKNTAHADGQLWEIQCADEERIPMMLMWVDDNRPRLPAALSGRRINVWSWDNIEAFINRL